MVLDEIIRNRKFALYGLSTETERMLREWDGRYQIVGLLDGFMESGELYGLPIISFEQVVREGTELIIVVARPGSCKAIAKRIGDDCREHGIEIFDIRGKDLLASVKVTYDFAHVSGYTYRQLLDAIKEVEVVSFDLFDTLIARNILSAADVIELTGERLREQGTVIDGFAERRMAAEKRLSVGGAPGLEDIYNELLATIHTDTSDEADTKVKTAGSDEANVEMKADIISDEGNKAFFTSAQLAGLEYETDCGLLVPRRAMISLMHEAVRLGRKVYITTDTYYSKAQITDILKNNGITGYTDVLVSCEYGVGKQYGLFEILKEKARGAEILHIGDDIVSDIESGARSGVRTFQIYSTLELFELTGGMGLSEHADGLSEHVDGLPERADGLPVHADGLSDRIRLGMYNAKLFNSPFQFEREDKRIAVNDASDIGYLFCAPMICDFTSWFGGRTKQYGVNNIWFCARDGYLIRYIFAKMYPSVETEYYLTSRIAAIRAGVESTEDIAYVDGMKFGGTTEESLAVRFGIDADDVPDADIDVTAEGLLRYRRSILNAAKIKRCNNIEYISTLRIKEGETAFFDFVAKGTSQMYAERIAKKRMKGFYFLQLEPEYMKDKNLDIEPFYAESEREHSAVFDNYYILETLLTSPEPSVEEFDADGRPVYAAETRSKKDIECFMRARDGVLEYVDTYLAVCPKECRRINKRLDEAFLTLIHNLELLDEDFLNLKVEDPFFHRMTDMMDIL